MTQVGNRTIYEKILQKGHEESERILEDGKTRAQLIVEVALEETNKALSIERVKRDAKFEELYKTKMTEFEQAMKQESLAKKKALLKQVFDGAMDKLIHQSDSDLRRYVVQTLKKDHLSGSLALSVNREEYKRYLSLFSSQKDGKLDLLSGAIGENVSLVLKKDSAPIQGGFLVIGTEFDIDHSYDAILKNLLEQMESEVANLLFHEELA